MSDFREDIVIHAPAEEVFRFVSSVANIPRYVPFLREVRLESGDHVVAFAEPAKMQRELNGFFRVSPSTYRIDWGTDGVPPYHGFMQLREAEDERRTVLTAQLTFEHRDDPAIRDALRQCVQAIKRLVEEEGGGKVMGGGAG
jgi:uncharacterized protein YndB with AHSA1/START domain